MVQTLCESDLLWLATNHSKYTFPSEPFAMCSWDISPFANMINYHCSHTLEFQACWRLLCRMKAGPKNKASRLTEHQMVIRKALSSKDSDQVPHQPLLWNIKAIWYSHHNHHFHPFRSLQAIASCKSLQPLPAHLVSNPLYLPFSHFLQIFVSPPPFFFLSLVSAPLGSTLWLPSTSAAHSFSPIMIVIVFI